VKFAGVRRLYVSVASRVPTKKLSRRTAKYGVFSELGCPGAGWRIVISPAAEAPRLQQDAGPTLPPPCGKIAQTAAKPTKMAFDSEYSRKVTREGNRVYYKRMGAISSRAFFGEA